MVDLAACGALLATPFPANVSNWVREFKAPGVYERSMQRLSRQLEDSVQSILAIPDSERTFANTVLAMDTAMDAFASESVMLKTVSSLILPVSEQEAAASEQYSSDRHSHLVDLNSNAALFKAIVHTPVAEGLESELKKALLRRMKENNVDLPAEKVQKISEISTESARLSAAYNNSIKNDTSTVLIQGRSIDVTNPSEVRSFLSSEPNENVRRQVYLAYRQRTPENAFRLLAITHLNEQHAKVSGKANWLEKTLNERSLAGGPKPVEDYLLELERGYQRAFRRQLASKAMKPWDLFYSNLDPASDRGPSTSRLTEAQIASYFPAPQFLKNFLKTIETMFEVRFEPIDSEPVWHESVRLYRVIDVAAGKTLGFMYLDLYSRPGKDSSTAFVEEIVQRRLLNDGAERLPVMILNTNWGPWEQADQLHLDLSQVNTALHEMGHAMHGLLQRGLYYAISGWSHPTDFMEVPSTSLDRMVKEPEMLMALAPQMSLEVAQQIAEEQKGFQMTSGDFFSTSHLQNTVFLSLFDMALQKQASKIKTPEQMHALYRKMYTEFYGMDPGPEDHFAQTFHHIAGEYAGNYSSYIWAGLVSANVVERLKELGGILNPKAIRIWRETMLAAPQYERTSGQVLLNFLGRPLSYAPVFKELGLEP